ncbi:hypothetical protein Tco_0747952 [Tanacetum coccineum]|uniref:Uncharacterized protein n=1 Tax=Tanacetum coccineum TaxID=301880 RepID=A0ABQ4YV47_9ASTR
MVVLESCPKHNMVAYLEKTEGNAEFHEVIDFLARSSIHHALTVSPVVSTTFVEQFWMSAKSKIINNVRYITAKVAGKPVSISEASIRSDLLFDDADGIDSLPNQAIFDAIQLMGYEGDLTVLTFNKALFSPQWRFLFHTMNHCISSKSTSWDQIPTNIATAVICLWGDSLSFLDYKSNKEDVSLEVQVTPKTSHLSVVKRIFRYLKGKPKLGLWYTRVSSFDLEAYSDSDYAGANLDRKSTTGGCQFLGRRLISWQCKKQTIVATSIAEAKYVAAANCCRQVLWIQNQMLDYGFNFINTKIYIDDESTICIVKNPVYHSKTKHVAIRHHFIRDAYEKKLI